MLSFGRRLQGIDSHYRFLISLATAAIGCAILFSKHVLLPSLIIITWDVFAITSLTLAWVHIALADPEECIRTAKLQDFGRKLIFFLVIFCACASLSAVAFLLDTGKGLPLGKLTEQVVLTIATVLVSWFLIHTGFALRYAHIFYGRDEHVEVKGEKTALLFPNEEDPDYMDFAYFSFVIGMTCQVSDVQICSRRVRRLALLHGLLAFLFNTVILALSINIVSSLL